MKPPKYQIGDSLYCATINSQDNWIICPECGGTKTLRCILFDETEYIIDCQGCSCGYEPPSGRVRVYKRTPKTEIVVISGIEVNLGEPIEYKVRLSECSYRHFKENELYRTKEEAEIAATKWAAKLESEELEEIQKKEKSTRSWAWHIHYHRQGIRQAEKDLLYHTSKLNAAKSHAKE